MDLTINILLVLAGVTTAIAAIGGETWRKGDGALIRRITHRGWISIAALAVTVIFGIAKEVRARGAAVQSERASERLRGQLSEARTQLDETRRLLQNVVLSNQPSRHVLNQVEAEITAVAKERGLPGPVITIFQDSVHYDFRDEGQPRQGYLALEKEDIATISLLSPEKQHDAIAKLGTNILDSAAGSGA